MEAILELNRQHLANFTDSVKESVAVNVTRLINARREDKNDGKNQNQVKEQCAHAYRKM